MLKNYPLLCTIFASLYKIGQNASEVIERGRMEVSMVVSYESVGNLLPNPKEVVEKLVATGIRVILAPCFSNPFLRLASKRSLLCISASSGGGMTEIIRHISKHYTSKDGELIYTPVAIEVDTRSNMLLIGKQMFSFELPRGQALFT